MSFQAVKQIHFCYGHRLIGYSGKCRNLHGHNGLVEVVLEGDRLDDLGMVTDFTQIKTVMQTWIDQELDHKMILCRQDPLVPLLQAHQQPLFLMDGNPTAEALAQLLYQVGRDNKLPVAEIRFWESTSSTAVYRP